MVKPARPVTVLPRLDAKPWGGRRLETWGIALPAGIAIGEALLTAPEAVVASGPMQGSTLGDLARRDPETWVGARGLAVTGGQPIFPLLVKLIDGRADLSIQVHPDDRAAAAAGLGTGKTEAYHVLSAEPGSVIFLGLEPETDPHAFAAACRRADGSAARFLHQVSAAPGMTVLIPAGTPHALGAGITIYEIQQPSNVTFRLDDWGRRDATGAARPLHHDDGLAVVDPRSRPMPIPRMTTGLGRELLVATRYFALERIGGATMGPVSLSPVESPQVLTCLAGSSMLDAQGFSLSISRGETVILPSGSSATLTGSEECLILRGWVPDIEQDESRRARAAGATETPIE